MLLVGCSLNLDSADARDIGNIAQQTVRRFAGTRMLNQCIDNWRSGFKYFPFFLGDSTDNGVTADVGAY